MQAIAVCLAVILSAAPGAPAKLTGRVRVMTAGSAEAASLEAALRDALAQAGLSIIDGAQKKGLADVDYLVRGTLTTAETVSVDVVATDAASKELLAAFAETQAPADATPAAKMAAANALGKKAATKVVEEITRMQKRRQTEGRSVSLTVKGLDSFLTFRDLTSKIAKLPGVREVMSTNMANREGTMEVMVTSAETLAKGAEGLVVGKLKATATSVTPAAVELTLSAKR
jgi:hypothetical protein